MHALECLLSQDRIESMIMTEPAWQWHFACRKPNAADRAQPVIRGHDVIRRAHPITRYPIIVINETDERIAGL